MNVNHEERIMTMEAVKQMRISIALPAQKTPWANNWRKNVKEKRQRNCKDRWSRLNGFQVTPHKEENEPWWWWEKGMDLPIGRPSRGAVKCSVLEVGERTKFWENASAGCHGPWAHKQWRRKLGDFSFFFLSYFFPYLPSLAFLGYSASRFSEL